MCDARGAGGEGARAGDVPRRERHDATREKRRERRDAARDKHATTRERGVSFIQPPGQLRHADGIIPRRRGAAAAERPTKRDARRRGRGGGRHDSDTTATRRLRDATRHDWDTTAARQRHDGERDALEEFGHPRVEVVRRDRERVAAVRRVEPRAHVVEHTVDLAPEGHAIRRSRDGDWCRCDAATHTHPHFRNARAAASLPSVTQSSTLIQVLSPRSNQYPMTLPKPCSSRLMSPS